MEIIHWIVDIILLALLIIFSLDGLTFLWVRRVYQLAYHFVIMTKPRWVIMIDVDGFKSINDNYGHRVGDKVLRKIGLLIIKESRLRGFRYGGEEFVVLLPLTGLEKAITLAERIRRKVGMINIDGLRVTVSVGIGEYEGEADKALYQAKLNGKNQVEIFVGPE